MEWNMMEIFEQWNIIGYIHVDSFASQLWERKYPFLKGSRFLVATIDGKVLAVSPEATKVGVSTCHTLKEAESICQNVNVVIQPEGSIEDKKISWEIMDTIKSFCDGRKIPYEHFPPDEFYLNLTNNVRYQIDQNRGRQKSRDPFPPYFDDSTNVYFEHNRSFKYYEIQLLLNYITRNLVAENRLDLDDSNEFKLKTEWDPEYYFAWNSIPVEDFYLLNILFGGSIMKNIVTELENCTGISCSASVASNMLLAKLACDFHPQGKTLTILTGLGMQRISSQIPVFSLPGIDDRCKLELMKNFANNLHQLAYVPLQSLETRFPPDIALKIYQSSKGICYTTINPNPVLQNVTFSNYKLRITTNKELRTQLELLLKPMLKKLEEELVNHKRDTDNLKVTFSCCDVSGKENLVAEAQIDYCAQEQESILFIAQRIYKEICKQRGFDSKFMTITSLEITHGKFHSVVGRNSFNFIPKYGNTRHRRYNGSRRGSYHRNTKSYQLSQFGRYYPPRIG